MAQGKYSGDRTKCSLLFTISILGNRCRDVVRCLGCLRGPIFREASVNVQLEKSSCINWVSLRKIKKLRFLLGLLQIPLLGSVTQVEVQNWREISNTQHLGAFSLHMAWEFVFLRLTNSVFAQQWFGVVVLKLRRIVGLYRCTVGFF